MTQDMYVSTSNGGRSQIGKNQHAKHRVFVRSSEHPRYKTLCSQASLAQSPSAKFPRSLLATGRQTNTHDSFPNILLPPDSTAPTICPTSRPSQGSQTRRSCPAHGIEQRTRQHTQYVKHKTYISSGYSEVYIVDRSEDVVRETAMFACAVRRARTCCEAWLTPRNRTRPVRRIIPYLRGYSSALPAAGGVRKCSSERAS